MRMSSWVSSQRRACGKLRPGGKGPAGPRLLGGRLEHREAPNQADERQVAVQPRPAPALVIAQAQLLFALLREALDRPPPMRQLELLRQRAPIQPPGEVPFGLTVPSGQGPFAEQPSDGPRDLAMRP